MATTASTFDSSESTKPLQATKHQILHSSSWPRHPQSRLPPPGRVKVPTAFTRKLDQKLETNPSETQRSQGGNPNCGSGTQEWRTTRSSDRDRFLATPRVSPPIESSCSMYVYFEASLRANFIRYLLVDTLPNNNA